MRATDEVGQLLEALHLRVRVRRALAWAGTLALPCATLWAAAPLLPFATRPWSHLLLAIPLLAAGAHLLGGRPRRLEALADRRLGLADGLRTLALAGDAGGTPYLRCLRTDLNLRLRHRDLARALPPPRIRGARWWLFPLIFLLLLRFALPDFIGSTGPAGFAGGEGGGAGEGAGGGGARTAGGPGDARADRGPQPPPPEGQPEPEPEPEPQGPEDDDQAGKDPGPIPTPEKFKDVFVPPVTDIDGPRTEKEIAAVEAPSETPPPRAPRREPRGAGDAPPAPHPAELERAAEEALERRRVDPAEARFVRRYFEILGRESR
jgi:hypothetical protein